MLASYGKKYTFYTPFISVFKNVANSRPPKGNNGKLLPPPQPGTLQWRVNQAAQYGVT